MTTELNNLDSSLFDEISDVLESPNTPRDTVERVQMKLLAAMWKSQNELVSHVKKQNGRIGTNEKAISVFTKWVETTKATINKLAFAFVLSFLGFLWAVLTHKIQIVFTP